MKAKFFPAAGRTALVRSLLWLCLAVCLSLSLLPAVPVSAEFYYDESMNRLVNWGVVRGYEDGSLRPDNPLTRAEFTAMVNRAYGYTEVGPMPFADVPATAWYADDIAIAYNAGYFEGTGGGLASPDTYLTREEAMVLLARNMRLESIPGEITEFSDGNDFSNWSRGYVKAAVMAGLITGDENNAFRPREYITRADMAVLLANGIGTLVNTSGATTLGSVYGNVTLNQPGSTLQDTTIYGDLILSGGLGLESVTLDNVRVLGRIIVAGGGESNSGESIVFRNTTADQLVVDSLRNQYIALRAEGDTLIPQTSLRSNAYVMDRTKTGYGLLNISLDKGNLFTLAGNLETVVDRAANSELRIGFGSVQTLTVDETAPGARLIVDRSAAVRTLNLDTGTAVTGAGDVGTLNVNTAGSSTEMLPDDIHIRPGLVSDVAGTEMTPEIARESSSEPRLEAGYPQVGNLAPTSATATFMTNKAGTIYWAVSAIADGSIGETDLIAPPTYATKIVKSGNLRADASGTEYKANITGLTNGGSYYLSAVLVDAREARSPVKVVSFTTPDNSVPNFSGGTPKVTLNKYDATGGVYVAQVMAIPNKTCQLYWALYASGATAPTAAEFRTGNLGGALAHSVMEVTRNEETYIDLNHFYTLQEKTDYIVYLWLNDADNGKSSTVRNVRFTTVDGTPPVFTLDLQQNGASTATTIPLTATINEDGTIYVVAVISGTKFPIPPAGGGPLTDEMACIQIEKNINNGTAQRVASARATANTPVNFSVTGLRAETSYDIWFIAKDAAGNYSVFTMQNYITASTLDTTAPTVTQEFLNKDASNRPFADTDIQLIFSENIQYRGSEPELQGLKLIDLYNVISNSNSSIDEISDARNKLAAILNSSIIFYEYYNGTPCTMEEAAEKVRTPDNNPSNWLIDYHNVKVEMDEGKVIVTFPTTDDTRRDSALNLKSGSTYRFEIRGGRIADTAGPPGPTSMNQTLLDPFTTVAAQVQLTERNAPTIRVGDQDVAADLVFSMEPLSANVSSDIDFDVLFWCDTSVKFVLYRYDPETNLWSPVVVRTDDSATASGEPTEVEIINNSAGKEFLGKSLYYHFEDRIEKGNSKFPAVVEELKEVRYAIHITEINGMSESTGRGSSWNAEINFRISVVTGMSSHLRSLARDISAEGLEKAMSEGVDEIQIPNPFNMRATFTNSSAPNFTGDYPMFTPSDTSVTIEVALDRPGTLYYVIAPASTKTTNRGSNETTITYGPTAGDTTMYNGGAQGTPVEFDIDPATGIIREVIAGDPTQKAVYAEDAPTRKYVPIQGDRSATDRAAFEFLLQAPTSRNIYNPNFNNGRIRAGNVEVTVGSTIITESGLEADTLYFVYFVTQGTGQVYSEHAMLYQFSTSEVFRPRFTTIISGNPTVDITNVDTVNERIDYAIFQLDTIITSGSPLGYDFRDHLNDAGKALSGDELAKVQNFKVYEAIQTPISSGSEDSYFDRYADAEFKRQIARAIQNSSTSGSRVNGGQTTVNVGAYTSVECDKLGIRPTIEYFFVACAWYNDPTSSNTSSDAVQPDSISFRGTSPVYQADSEPPKLTEISGTVTVDFDDDGKPTFDSDSNTIYLTFDKDLYYYDYNNSGTRLAITMVERGNAESGFVSVDTNSVVTGTGYAPVYSSPQTPNKKTNTIPVKMTREQLTLSITPYLVSEGSDPRYSSINFTLNVPNSNGVVQVTQASTGIYTIDGELWSNGPNIHITFVISGKNVPTAISLDKPSLSLNVKDKGYLVATVLPASIELPKDARVDWSLEGDTGAVTFTLNGVTDTATVTAVSPGTVTVIATVLDSSGRVVYVNGEPLTARCVITVIAPAEANLNTSSYTIKKGETVQDAIKVELENAEDAKVTIGEWKSSNNSVATVSTTVGDNSGGTLRGVSEGAATITVNVTIDGETQKLTCKVTVVE